MQERTAFLGSESVGRLMVRLSLPAIVGMTVQASYNIVDALFVGRGVGALGLAGTVAVFPLQIMVFAVAAMVGVGAASLISRSLGEGKTERAEQALGISVTLSLSAGTILALAGWLGLSRLFSLLGTAPECLPYARAYTEAILFGIPFQALGMSLNSGARAEGKARIAMMTMVISGLVNVVLDALFIFGFGMGVAGAAWATVIAQVTSTVWLVLFYRSGRSALRLRWACFRPDPIVTGQILSVGASEFARLFANGLVVALVLRVLSLHGNSLAVAAYGVIGRILSLTIMPILGIAQGMQPIVGYNYGARLYGRTRRAIGFSVAAATGVSCLAFALLALSPSMIFGVFTSDPELSRLGARSLRFMTFGFFCIGFQIVGSALFQALGKSGPALFLSLSRQVLIFLPLLVLFPRLWGLTGVWLSFPAADILSALVTLVFFRGQMKELARVASKA